MLSAVSLVMSLSVLAAEPGADWPQFLGPARNGVYAEGELADKWPAGGPKVLWEMKVGSGWSAPAVAGGKVIAFHRVGDRETVECVEAGTGRAVWKAEYDTVYTDDFGFDNGPRATPALDEGKVYYVHAGGAR
jgi:hypothetical protein